MPHCTRSTSKAWVPFQVVRPSTVQFWVPTPGIEPLPETVVVESSMPAVPSVVCWNVPFENSGLPALSVLFCHCWTGPPPKSNSTSVILVPLV